ncbi:MAG: adenylate/guanylate cyclase domain-containing protein, partial [Acidimicrobiia bacterium]
MQTRMFGSLWPVSPLTIGGGGIGQAWGETSRADAVGQTPRTALGGSIGSVDQPARSDKPGARRYSPAVVARPSGTVTFLFSDVAGSTRLWESDRRGMASSLARHDRILTAAINDAGGYVFSTAGDSFAAAFPTPTGALTAAMTAQIGLLTETWEGPPIRVRMGVHTGTSYERAGDYFGPNVNRASRVMSASNGGQILVSGVTAQLVADQIEAPLSLEDRGVHPLKDLDRPEHLFEALHPDLPPVFDPLRTAPIDRLHLPVQLSSFVGRKAELEAVTALLEESRLVTLTGVGGTGKTRLAIEVASGLEDPFPDGVWMVGLADVSDPALIVNEVAELWGLRPGEGMELIQVIRAHLARTTLLILLDNCEHVRMAAADLAAELVASSPGLRVLATSRESLGIPGEAVYRVPSLGIPGEGSDLARSESVRLFVDRATHLLPGFSPSSSELEAIARICRRLDGIPLGIELAAARIRTLTVFDLADRLDESFRILTAASKTTVRRQRTLESAIAWSYDLLSDEEAALFRRLSVFAGGFDLTAADAMGRGEDVLTLLDQLVDKSLVIAIPQERTSRFKLLEPIRQFGELHLSAAGESSEARILHAEHYATWIGTIEPKLRGPQQAEANRDLLMENDNIRSALGTFLDRGQVDRFLEVCFDLTWFWSQSSLQVEARDTLVEALTGHAGEISPAHAARAWFVAALLATFLTDPDAVEYADRGLEAAERTDDGALIGWLTLARGMTSSNMAGQEESQDWMEGGRRLIAENLDRPLWDRSFDDAVVEFMLG